MFRIAAVKDSENSEYLEYIPTLEAWAKVRAILKVKMNRFALELPGLFITSNVNASFFISSMPTSIGQQVISSTVNHPPEVFDLTV